MLRFGYRALALMMLALLAACGNPSAGPPGSGTDATLVNDRVRVIDQTTQANVSEFTLDRASGKAVLRFKAGDPMAGELEAGEVVVSSPIPGVAPYGFLQRIKSTSKQGDEILVQTEQATLTDVFDQAKIHYEQVLRPTDVVSVQSRFAGVSFRHDHPGMPQPLAGASFDFGIGFDEVLVDVDGNPATTDDQLTLDGSFDFNASAKADIDIGWLADLERFYFVVRLDESADLQVQGDLSEDFDESVEVARYNFGSFTVMVGPVPVVFTIDLALEVGCQGQITAHIETGATQSTSVQVGAEYKNDDWHGITSADSSFSYTTPTFTASADARGYARPSLHIRIYGLAGPYIYAEAYFEGDAELYRDPFWELTGGLGFGIGFNIELPIVGEVADWSTQIAGVEKTIQSSQNAPPELVVEVVEPADGGTLLDGGALEINVAATDREQEDVDVALADASETIATKVSERGSSREFHSDALCIGSYDFVVSATDSDQHTVREPLTIVVENHVPELTISEDLLPTPGVFRGGYFAPVARVSDVTCSDLSGNDSDPALVEWFIDGVKVGMTNGAVMSVPDGYEVGDSFALEARYDDGYDVGVSDDVQITVVTRPAGGNLPPQAIIVSPSPDQSYTLGNDCAYPGYLGHWGAPFVGRGVDPEAGGLPDANLTWQLDGAYLATGAEPTVNFCTPFGGQHPPEKGEHDLSLTVTDSDGQAATSHVTIRTGFLVGHTWP